MLEALLSIRGLIVSAMESSIPENSPPGLGLWNAHKGKYWFGMGSFGLATEGAMDDVGFGS